MIPDPRPNPAAPATATAAAPRSDDSLLRRAAPFLVMAAVWLLRHPYQGVTHDGTFYMAVAIQALAPEMFRDDLFFAFGSQGDFTLYGPVLAALVKAFDVSGASVISVILGHIVWVSGALALLARMTGSLRAATLPFLCVAALYSRYAGFDLLHYAEGFPTPRVFAEGLSLWGLWALAGHRFALAGGLYLTGLLLHPIMGVIGAGLGLVYLILGDRRWGLPAVAGMAAILGLAAIGVSPADRLFQTFDREWLALVEARNIYLFPTEWAPAQWARLVFAAGLTLAAAAAVEGWQRRVLLAAVLTALFGMAGAIVFGDLLHNVLAIQLQPSRAAWLIQFFGNAGVALLLIKIWQQRENALPLTALLALGWAMTNMLSPVHGVFVGLVAATLGVLQLRFRPGVVKRFYLWLIVGLSVLALGAAFGLRAYLTGGRVIRAAGDGTAQVQSFLHVAPIDALAVAALVFIVIWRWPGLARRAAPACAMIAVICAAAVWDRRADWDKLVEGGADMTALQRLIPADSPVYFEIDVRGAWTMLRRPTYGAVSQGAGISFSRDGAMAYRSAVSDMGAIMGRSATDIFRQETGGIGDLPALGVSDIIATCRKAPDLDFMFLSRRVEGAYAAEWRLPVPRHDLNGFLNGTPVQPVEKFYLYDCRGVRRIEALF